MLWLCTFVAHTAWAAHDAPGQLLSGNGSYNYQGCISPEATSQPYCNYSLSIPARVASLVASMNISEKAKRMSVNPDDSAIARLGLPPYAWLMETNTAMSAQCLNGTKCATNFVGPEGLAASFNRSVWRQKGEVVSTEARAFSNNFGTKTPGSCPKGTSCYTSLTGYGPNINILRSPRFGRNSEMVGEDPLLSGTYAKEMVSAQQLEDAAGHPRMMVYLKHYTAYTLDCRVGGPPPKRQPTSHCDTDNNLISPYDFADTYLPQYQIAMTVAGGVMCAYSAENGVPSCANDWLLNTVLRKRWHRPDAVVTSDCAAISHLTSGPAYAPGRTFAAAWGINNGTDIDCGSMYDNVPRAVEQGILTEAMVDKSLSRSLTHLFRLGYFDPIETVKWANISADVIDSPQHRRMNFEAALQSVVLLRNDGGSVLPLKAGTRIAVVGPLADARHQLMSGYTSMEPCARDINQTTDSCIWSIAAAVRHYNGDDHSLTTNASGIDVNSTDTSRIADAMALAKAADVVVVALGTDSSIEAEGVERFDISLPGQQLSFATQVIALNKPTVVVTVSGGQLAIDSLATAGAKVAIINAFNPCILGMKGVAAQIFGEENRWGRLPYTIFNSSYMAEQSEWNFDITKPPGQTYRYYNGSNALWSFGSGLSLTTFSFNCSASDNRGNDVVVTTSAVSANTIGNHSFVCTVHNTGSRSGDEVLLMFHRPTTGVRARADHVLPLKRLIGFDRVGPVRAGGSATVQFEVVPSRDLMLATADGNHTLYAGTHEIVFWDGSGPEVTLPIEILTNN